MKGKGVVYPDGFLRALFSSLLQQVRILKQERKVLFQVVKLREMCRSQFNSQLFIPGLDGVGDHQVSDACSHSFNKTV